ncbi:hypothetical protein HYH03_000476 [Edaphochlamys debaryana]|uniref:Uncharacterized protein n=1 Tax=Edaphochlamys debaryana TaxID=47281 RepID=A0A835YP25_9CHLO|nr:hypothetical protein HYH03_000476 [Edaphochlamys debaryana]|eukprot:KAG2501980.1 hypothetical protein HYH03_000476 [Edaphochlamys debaryana]
MSTTRPRLTARALIWALLVATLLLVCGVVEAQQSPRRPRRPKAPRSPKPPRPPHATRKASHATPSPAPPLALRPPPKRSPPSPRRPPRSPPPSPPRPRRPPSPPRRSPRPPPLRQPSPPRPLAAEGPLTGPSPDAAPQYYMCFGRCGWRLQQARFGTWVVYYSRKLQVDPNVLVLTVDTRNASPVAPEFGTVEPADFPIRQLNIAYHDHLRGVKEWSPVLDQTSYRETPTYYGVRVNGDDIVNVRDLKDSGTNRALTSIYSLKARLNGVVAPSKERYTVEVYKRCRGDEECAAIPDPAAVFISPLGHIAYSFFSVNQPLTINGQLVPDHGWCPVQTAINID